MTDPKSLANRFLGVELDRLDAQRLRELRIVLAHVLEKRLRVLTTNERVDSLLVVASTTA